MQTSTSSASRSSIDRYLSVTGLSLWALVMALAPDPGFSAPFLWLSLFWAMQIAIGLTVLQTTLYLLSRADRQGRMPLWSLVTVSGFCGAAVLTPIYWMIGGGLMQQVSAWPRHARSPWSRAWGRHSSLTTRPKRPCISKGTRADMPRASKLDRSDP